MLSIITATKSFFMKKNSRNCDLNQGQLGTEASTLTTELCPPPIPSLKLWHSREMKRWSTNMMEEFIQKDLSRIFYGYAAFVFNNVSSILTLQLDTGKYYTNLLPKPVNQKVRVIIFWMPFWREPWQTRESCQDTYIGVHVQT